MKTAYTIFFNIVTVLVIQVLFYAGTANADISVLSGSLSGLVISYRPSPGTPDSLIIKDKTYIRFNYNTHISSNPPGAPAIPMKSIYFAVPGNVVPAVEITNLSESGKSDILLAPVPRHEKDKSGFYIEVYEEDPAFYALSGYRPRNFVELGTHDEIGGITIWELILTPVLYDAHASRAAIANSFDVNITFGSQKITAQALPQRIPEYLINYEVFQNIAVRKPAAPVANPFSNGDWYKIILNQNGMFGISGAELSGAGFPVGSVRPDEIRMYYGGGKLIETDNYDFNNGDFREIPVKIIDAGKDGIFDSGDIIVFYGEAISRFIPNHWKNKLYFQNHLYSDNNVFWLTVSNEGAPLRIQSTGELPAGGGRAKTTYRCQKHIEHDYQLELVNAGNEWFWEAILSTYRQFTITAPGCVPGTKSQFRVGFLNQKEKRPHDIYLYVNEQKAQSYRFEERKGFITHDYDGDLKQGNNIINIVREWKPGENFVSVRLDWIEIEYERELSYISNNFEFFHVGDGTASRFTVSNVKKPSIEAYDTTDPFNVGEFTYSPHNSGNNTLTFQVTIPENQTSRFTMCDPASYLKVSSITKTPLKNLRNSYNNANYILITHNLFMEEARKLANWRARDSQIEPLSPMVVDIADIYDEFNWGVLDPLAARSFLWFVWENGSPDVNYYCCILGDTTYKYKNLSESQAGRNFVPTYTEHEDLGSLTTDDYFCWFDMNRFPAYAIGRLCATDKETAQILVDKTIEYERNPEQGLWHNRVLLIGDDELTSRGNQEVIHSRQTESLDAGIKSFTGQDSINFIPHSMERLKIMLIEYPLKNLRKPDVTEVLLSAIDKGYVVANFIGHGNDDLLAHEHILVGTRDIERFNNGGRQPLFAVFSCTVGNFIQLENLSLAEMLHLRKGGGAIGVVAATSLTFSVANLELNESYYLNLFYREKNQEHRIGHALLLAKHDVNDLNSNRYMLFGDPASRLMIPRYDFKIAPVDTIYRLQKLDLTGTINSGDNTVQYNGTMYIRALGPKIHKTYNTAFNRFSIEYTQPGKTFYFGEYAISGDSFNAAIVVPKDIPSKGTESYIYFFATGGDAEASGDLHNFTIGGLDKNAPDDRNGPEIELSFDGKQFDDGDYISRQPTLRAVISDPSSINIYGNRGHNITLLIDKNEIVILTDRFKAINGYTSGVVEYTLPILSPGEHTLEMKVYDTYNNASKKCVTVHVVGTETGDISIINLLNYPNPMDSNGTTFTFSLTDDARLAEIKIYSQSGRLVDTRKFSAGYGFNQVDWKPPFTIANGVYFYKLTVKSVNGRKSSKIEKLVVMK